MSKLILAIIGVAMLGGCVVYEHDRPYYDHDYYYHDHGWDHGWRDRDRDWR